MKNRGLDKMCLHATMIPCNLLERKVVNSFGNNFHLWTPHHALVSKLSEIQYRFLDKHLSFK